MPDYDAIVIGVGGMGSAALHALASRGARVCGIERYGVAHAHGSSHGETRIIRKAYFEHPDYVPLLHRAYELWGELEAASGVDLFSRCGFLACGQPDSESIRGLEASYAAHEVAHERLDREAVQRRYPQIALEPGSVGFLDPTGGYLRVEECVRQQVARAGAAGAELFLDEAVQSWSQEGAEVVVRTAAREVSAAKLALTTGAWAVPELTRLGIDTKIWRKVLLWYDSPDLSRFTETVFPTFYVETSGGHFYGFPVIDDKGLKVAEHHGFTLVDDPDDVRRELLDGDESIVLDFLAATFPAIVPRRTRHVVCMYTVTPDHHFVIDRHPESPAVVIAAGFSGHGFKFAPVVGELVADLALDGRTAHEIDFLRLRRFVS